MTELSVAPLVGGEPLQHEGGGRRQWGAHPHLQEHQGGGPQAHTPALQDTHAGSGHWVRESSYFIVL